MHNEVVRACCAFSNAGASDCASQIATMLEVARALAADPGVRLAAPVVFLFDGGEETFSQAAHGFMQKYDKPLGVFVNLESTGPGGPDYVFQQTGESQAVIRPWFCSTS
jgi:acetylornithine deacetylase/succinyl-diaminopimelate desuccinylase-like protein